MKRDQLPEEVKAKFLELLAEDHSRGNDHALVQAFKDCGDHVFKSEVKHLLDDDLLQDAREARGWVINRVEGVRWEVALDKDHPKWDPASYSLLRAYSPAFREQSRLELTGADGQPVQFEDRSASLDDVARVLTATGALDRRDDDQPTVAAPDIAVAPPRDV